MINKSDNDVQETFLLHSNFMRRPSWLVVRVLAGIIIVLLCTYMRSVIKKSFECRHNEWMFRRDRLCCVMATVVCVLLSIAFTASVLPTPTPHCHLHSHHYLKPFPHWLYYSYTYYYYYTIFPDFYLLYCFFFCIFLSLWLTLKMLCKV